MYRTFKGDSRLEVITMIARCTKPDHVVHAVRTYIANKQEKGRNTSQIISKLEELEARFTKDDMVCEAFHKARADMNLPRSRILPESKHYSGPDIAGSPMDSPMSPTRPLTARSDSSIIGSFYSEPPGSAETRWSSESGGASIRTRPRGLSNPLPDSTLDETEQQHQGISRRMSEHDEPPVVVPHNLRLYRTSRSRGRSRSRDAAADATAAAAAAAAAALSSGESDDDAMRYQRRRSNSLVGPRPPKQPLLLRRLDASLGRGREAAADDPAVGFRRRTPSRLELERPKSPVRVYPVISEDGESRAASNGSSRISVSDWPLHELLEDQVAVLSPANAFLPPTRYSYRGMV